MKTITCPCCQTEYDATDCPVEFDRVAHWPIAQRLLNTLKSATAWIRMAGGDCQTLDQIIRESENQLTPKP